MSARTEADQDYRPLFDGQTLAGWHPAPRVYGSVYPGGPSVADMLAERGLEPPVAPESHPARWFVEDGAVVGRLERV